MKPKRCVCPAMIAWLLGMVLFPCAAQALSVHVSDATAQPGATDIAVSVEVDNAAGIAGGDLTLTYDAAVLTAKQASGSSLLTANSITLIPNLNTPGQVKLSMAGASGIASGSGVLVTISFDVSSSAPPGTYKIEFTRVTLRDEQAQALSVQSTDGILTISSDGPQPPGPSTGSTIKAESASGSPGDTDIAVAIAVENLAGLAGGDITLTYDATALTATMVKAGDLAVSGGITVIGNTATEGQVKISLAGAVGLSSGSGTLATLTFDIKDTAQAGTYDITFAKATLRDENAAVLTVSETGNGTITVENGTPGEGPRGPIALDLNTEAGDQEKRMGIYPKVGDTFIVDVTAVSGAQDQVGFQVTLRYDPTQLAWVGFEVKDLWATGMKMPDSVSGGSATVSVAILGGKAPRDAGSLGHATFKVLGGYTGETSVELAYARYDNEVTIGSGGAVVAIGGEEPPPVKLTPDFDGDGMVGFTDFIQFAQVFGASEGDPKYDAKFDLDEDSSIGFTDFIRFAQAFGKPASEVGKPARAAKSIGLLPGATEASP